MPSRPSAGPRALIRGRLAGLAGLLLLAACGPDPAAVPHLTQAADARPHVVPTRQGPVRGVATPEGQAYLGIPFAAPPTGERRWRAPGPAEPWTAERDATQLGPGCLENYSPAYQRGGSSRWLIRGDEDCLNLNVYAPASARPGDRLPVMVWLYGGGLVLGSNRQYDPSHLAQAQRVIVVAPNYRLGTLGFLAHPGLRGENGTANAGLLDQQAALRWVRDNIAGFGGDPGNVTLFGESAGSWSACFQMASPGAAGLFHRVILQSGVCTLPISTVPLARAEAAGAALARELGCGEGEAGVACLRRKPAAELAAAAARTPGMLGVSSWGPAHGDAVLPLAPGEVFARPDFHGPPVINGTTRDEGRLFAALYRMTGALFTEASYEAAVTRLLGDRAVAALRAYPSSPSGGPALAFAQLVTDGIFACPALRLNRLLAARLPLRAYQFADPSPVSSLPALPFLPPLGAYHASEIPFIFRTRWILADPSEFSPAQHALAERMQAAWGRFARSGDPNGGDLPAWPPYREDEDTTLALRPAGIGLIGPDLWQTHRCGVWEALGL